MHDGCQKCSQRPEINIFHKERDNFFTILSLVMKHEFFKYWVKTKIHVVASFQVTQTDKIKGDPFSKKNHGNSVLGPKGWTFGWFYGARNNYHKVIYCENLPKLCRDEDWGDELFFTCLHTVVHTIEIWKVFIVLVIFISWLKKRGVEDLSAKPPKNSRWLTLLWRVWNTLLHNIKSVWNEIMECVEK